MSTAEALTAVDAFNLQICRTLLLRIERHGGMTLLNDALDTVGAELRQQSWEIEHGETALPLKIIRRVAALAGIDHEQAVDAFRPSRVATMATVLKQFCTAHNVRR